MSDSIKILKELWREIVDKFNHPAINEPKVVDSLPSYNSAAFDWEERRVKISEQFIRELSKYLPREKVIQAIIEHEVGHYVVFPRELSDQIYLLAQASKIFGRKGEIIFNYYVDLVNEASLLKDGLSGDELIDTRDACHKMLVSKNIIKKGDVDMNRLMVALYRYLLKLPPIQLNEREQSYFDKLKEIPYFNRSIREHFASMYRFGKIIEDLIDEEQAKGEGRGESAGIGSCSICSLEGIPSENLDRALTDILRKLGPRAFRLSKDYLKKVRPDFKDSFGDENDFKSKNAGIGRTNFKLNDELIPLYKRWAASYGVYIVKRPFEKDSTSLYRSGKKEYEVGDPIHKIDIFGSRGYVGVPGISKTYLEEEGTIPSVEWSIPHLFVGIDSSGSMEHPASPRGAPQVLAAFILGNNYYANGAYVGGWNFSTDIAYLAPSRDIDAFYSLMCGYWGGGTVLNVEKLKEFLAKTEIGKRRLMFSDEKDYERMLEHLPHEKRMEFLDKSLEIDMSKIKMKVKKLDNVIITDGYILNAEDVLRYLQNMGEITRNFVFITDKEKYNEWSNIKLPNTWIYLAEKPEDLVGLALGRGKALVEESKHYSRGGDKI
jgi:hypothetical protein